jgi:KDO2-lipid IV(A) lauroyltransferase
VSRLAHLAQYAAARTVIGALGLLGWRLASACGAQLGRLAYAPVGVRRRVVLEQLRASFPDWGEDEVVRVAAESYESLGRSWIEAAVLSHATREDVLRLVPTCTGWEHITRATTPGPDGTPPTGAIIVAGHLGNWEVGAAYVAARGAPVDAIVRGVANPWFDAYVTRTRERFGVRVVRDRDAVRTVPRAIREGRVIGMLCDQDGLNLASTFVPFFGRLAKTPRGPAVLARRLGCPVLYVSVVRQPGGTYHFHVEPVTVSETGDREADVEAMVTAYTRRLEEEIRRVPGQYFWQHRRWKRRPPGEGA